MTGHLRDMLLTEEEAEFIRHRRTQQEEYKLKRRQIRQRNIDSLVGRYDESENCVYCGKLVIYSPDDVVDTHAGEWNDEYGTWSIGPYFCDETHTTRATSQRYLDGVRAYEEKKAAEKAASGA